MPIGRFCALASRATLWSFSSRRRQSSCDQARVSSYEEENAAGSDRNASRRMARRSRQSRGTRATTDTSWSSLDTDEEILSVGSLGVERKGQIKNQIPMLRAERAARRVRGARRSQQERARP